MESPRSPDEAELQVLVIEEVVDQPIRSSWYLFECHKCEYTSQVVDTTYRWAGDCYVAGDCPNCGVVDNLLLGEIYL